MLKQSTKGLWALLLAVPLVLGYAACAPKECPSKGWVSDRCAPVGELQFGNTLYRIPNTPPEKYKWSGSVTYTKETNTIRSPNLAFYWESGLPGGSEGPPKYQDDMVLFSLEYDLSRPNETEVWHLRKEGVLTPGAQVDTFLLRGFKEHRFSLEAQRDPDAVSRVFVESGMQGAIINCPSKREEPNLGQGGSRKRCHAYFYPKPGVRVSALFRTSELREWQKIRSALESKINSWEK